MADSITFDFTVACGAASHLRLKLSQALVERFELLRRMWSGFSSEIETPLAIIYAYAPVVVACGAASHLRLKPPLTPLIIQSFHSVACGAASHLRLKLFTRILTVTNAATSHVERLLI